MERFNLTYQDISKQKIEPKQYLCMLVDEFEVAFNVIDISNAADFSESIITGIVIRSTHPNYILQRQYQLRMDRMNPFMGRIFTPKQWGTQAKAKNFDEAKAKEEAIVEEIVNIVRASPMLYAPYQAVLDILTERGWIVGTEFGRKKYFSALLKKYNYRISSKAAMIKIVGLTALVPNPQKTAHRPQNSVAVKPKKVNLYKLYKGIDWIIDSGIFGDIIPYNDPRTKNYDPNEE